MNSNDVRAVLDVRSYENIVVATSPDTVNEYPEDMVAISDATQLNLIDEHSVLLVDKIDIPRRSLPNFFARKPRMIGFVVRNVEHEKRIRKFLSTSYPFDSVWTFATDFGKVVATDAKGSPYVRDNVLDERPEDFV